MLVIKVWCLPLEQTEDDLNRLHQAIVAAVISIVELGLKSENDMFCLFPPDRMKYGLGNEILVEVSGLKNDSEEVREVRRQIRKYLRESIGKSVKGLYPEAIVQCDTTVIDPSDEIWISTELDDVFECEMHGSIEHMQSSDGKCPGCGKP